MSFSEWEEVKLKDVVDILGDGLHGTPEYNDSGEYYFINGNNLNGNIVIDDKTKRVSHEEYLKYRKDLNDTTILVSINGTLGNVALYKEEKIILGKSACYFNVNQNVDKYYVMYVMKSDCFRQYARSYATGTTIKNLGLKQIREFPFSLPPINEQKSIAHILSTLDEKIEVNSQINKTLEAMAQEIFKHWFVDFEFPNENGEPYKSGGGEMVESELGMIPKGWEVKKLVDISSDIIAGKTPSTKDKQNFDGKIPFVKIPDMHGNVYIIRTESYLSEIGVDRNKIIPKNSVIVSCIATPGLVSLASEECQTNQQINTIICRVKEMCYFTFFLLKNLSDYIKTLGSTGSATLNLNKNEFSKIKVIIPTMQLINNYYKLVSGAFDNILNNQKMNIKLENFRDTLLPKLMSGEIHVPLEEGDLA